VLIAGYDFSSRFRFDFASDKVEEENAGFGGARGEMVSFASGERGDGVDWMSTV
jgi:hypothetical protein